ncbi:single-stranded DNA-binding protein [Brucepastera parasyntrophica]|uniref:single-stranded DNA-binding protein n=1 Tax=Brucepastera parasyntrophica TaxID=2880008 RepID=UPI00210DD404|nr:single-stranded DNA-binding protein [Brucepastera parasyntrophica]ULQ59685.1 single-stranded DNA-binding protein [Brucepastera parasyntrophica]
MNSLNSIILEGNVVRDSVVKETPKGTSVCTFSIASNRFYRQEEEYEQETSFFDVETWSRLADACGKYCLKGRGIRVIGRLKQDRWKSADGTNYSKVKVVAEHVEFKPVLKKDGGGKNTNDSEDTSSGETTEVFTEETVPEVFEHEAAENPQAVYSGNREAIPAF